jgi:hypothetical protein
VTASLRFRPQPANAGPAAVHSRSTMKAIDSHVGAVEGADAQMHDPGRDLGPIIIRHANARLEGAKGGGAEARAGHDGSVEDKSGAA